MESIPKNTGYKKRTVFLCSIMNRFGGRLYRLVPTLLPVFLAGGSLPHPGAVLAAPASCPSPEEWRKKALGPNPRLGVKIPRGEVIRVRLYDSTDSSPENIACLNKGLLDFTAEYVHIKRLRVSGNHLRASGLRNLSKLIQLEELDLRYAKGPHQSKEYLKGLVNLEKVSTLRTLDISGAYADNDAMEYVARLQSLRNLILERSNVTAEGLRRLKPLTNLRVLDLKRSRRLRLADLKALYLLPGLELNPNHRPRRVSASSFRSFIRDYNARKVAHGIFGAGGDPEALLELEKIRILNLKNFRRVKTGDFALLKYFPRVRELNLDSSSFRDENFKDLRRLRHLEKLDLSRTRVSDGGLARSRLPAGLRTLHLNETPISDSGLRGLARLRKLRELSLVGSRIDMLKKRPLRHLRALRSLRILRFLETREFSKRGARAAIRRYLDELIGLEQARLRLKAFGKTFSLDELRGISLLELSGGKGATKELLASLRGLPRLQEIRLRKTNVNDAALSGLHELKGLRTLDLGAMPFNADRADSLDNLKKIVQLKRLVFYGTWSAGKTSLERYVDSTRALKRACEYLRSIGVPISVQEARVQKTLDLSGKAGISARGLALLAALPALRSVTLVNSDANDAALKGLRELPGLRELRLGDMPFPPLAPDPLANLRALKGIEYLEFYGTYRFPRDSDKAYAATLKEIRLLKTARDWLIRFGRSFTIHELRSLSSLDLSGKTGVGGQGLERLIGLKSLTSLRLDRSDVSDENLKGIARLPGLRRLYLNRTSLSDRGLFYLKDASDLRILELRRTHVTPQGLRHLSELKKLEKLIYEKKP